MTDNRATATSFLKAIGANGPAAAAAAYGTPDYVWWALGVGEVQSLLSRIGGAMFDHLDDDGLRIDVLSTTAEGNRVAVEAKGHARLKDGRLYENQYHFLLEFDGDRIAVVKEYGDTAHLADVWGEIFAPLLA